VTPELLHQYALVMKECGITELMLDRCKINMPYYPVPTEQIKEMQILDQTNDPIKHKVEQMSSLLKVNDHDLVDQLFPDKDPDGVEIGA
jgi:hypothetical protein